MKQHIFIAILVGFLLSCASKTNHQDQRLSLARIQLFKIGVSVASDIEKEIGKPSLKAPIGEDQEAWLYLEGSVPTTRFSVIFDRSSYHVKKMNWFVRESETESNLSSAQAHFSAGKFTLQTLEWTNPHMGPDEVLYVSSEQNVQIVFQKSSKKVSSIVWDVDPLPGARQPASKVEF